MNTPIRLDFSWHRDLYRAAMNPKKHPRRQPQKPALDANQVAANFVSDVVGLPLPTGVYAGLMERLNRRRGAQP